MAIGEPDLFSATAASSGMKFNSVGRVRSRWFPGTVLFATAEQNANLSTLAYI